MEAFLVDFKALPPAVLPVHALKPVGSLALEKAQASTWRKERCQARYWCSGQLHSDGHVTKGLCLSYCVNPQI